MSVLNFAPVSTLEVGHVAHCFHFEAKVVLCCAFREAFVGPDLYRRFSLPQHLPLFGRVFLGFGNKGSCHNLDIVAEGASLDNSRQ